MKKTLILIFTFLSLTTFSQESDSQNRYLTYGTTQYYNQLAKEIVGKNWKIEIVQVSGSTVTRRIIDSVSEHNEKLWLKLDSLKGLNSSKLFHKQVATEMKRIQDSENLFNSNRKVKKRIRKIEKIRKDTATALEKVNDDVYLWTVYSLGSHNSSEFGLIYEFAVKVNIQNKKVNILTSD